MLSKELNNQLTSEMNDQSSASGLDQMKLEIEVLESLYQAWLMGDAGQLPELPVSWGLSELPADEQSLLGLAMASQYGLLTQDASPTHLEPLKQLPDTELPVLPQTLRPKFRLLLTAFKQNEHLFHRLLLLLETRGWVPHPQDWLPQGQFTRVPDSLVRWLALTGDKEFGDSKHADQVLTPENWQSYKPAVRLRLLEYIRKRDPAYARDLLEQCAAQETPDKRIALFKTLEIGLGDDDLPLLKKAMGDRSAKVTLVIQAMLNRLGNKAAQEEAEILSELNQWLIPKTKGIIKKRLRIAAPLLKNSVKMRNLCDALRVVPLEQLAAALSITMEELLSGWAFDTNEGQGVAKPNRAFVENAVSSLNDSCLSTLLENLVSTNESGINLLYELETLSTRLTITQQQALILDMLKKAPNDLLLDELWEVSSLPWEWLSASELKGTKAYKKLISHMSNILKSDRDEPIKQMNIRRLELIGLILSAECAEMTVADLQQAGVSPFEPALDTLQFNISLKQEGNQDE